MAKLIYTDTNGNGVRDMVHAYSCTDGQRLLRTAQNQWNWDVFEAGTRAEVSEFLHAMYAGDVEDVHYAPCVTIK